MRVKMLTLYADANGKVVQPGHETDFDDTTGQQLVDTGQAVPVEADNPAQARRQALKAASKRAPAKKAAPAVKSPTDPSSGTDPAADPDPQGDPAADEVDDLNGGPDED